MLCPGPGINVFEVNYLELASSLARPAFVSLNHTIDFEGSE